MVLRKLLWSLKIRQSEHVFTYNNSLVARFLPDHNGWVLEHDGVAIDLVHPCFTWKPSSEHYKDCIGDFEKVDSLAKRVMAR